MSGVESGLSSVSDVKPKLLDQLEESLRARHYNPRTEKTYHNSVKRFICFHKVRHPAEIGGPEINAFPTYLAVTDNVSASIQNLSMFLTVRYLCSVTQLIY